MHHRISATGLFIVAACLPVSAAGAQQGTAPDPLVPEDVTVKLGEHTYVIPDRNVGLVPNVGIVVGSRAVLVIDPGLGRRNGETVLREVAKLADDVEIYVASTHYHAEHTTGFLGFPSAARYISSTIQQEEFARSGDQQIRAFSNRSPLTAELLADATIFETDISFEREYTLDLGGVSVQFLVVGPTHTDGDTGFFVEEDGVLFSGDVVMNESFLAANQGSSMNAWLAAFDAFDALDPDIIVPAHGPVGEGSIIATNREIMEGIRARVSELKSQGRSADEVATTVQAEYRQAYPDWPRSNGLAAAALAAYREAP